jgi:hypothetical protein
MARPIPNAILILASSSLLFAGGAAAQANGVVGRTCPLTGSCSLAGTSAAVPAAPNSHVSGRTLLRRAELAALGPQRPAAAQASGIAAPTVKPADTPKLGAFLEPALAGLATPTLSVDDVSLDEDSCQNRSFLFTVTLSRLANKAVTVNYATSDGSPQTGAPALANKDYVPVSGALTFTHDSATEGPHGTYLLRISVPLGDHVVSSGTTEARSFSVTLSGATNATISRAQGVGTLLDPAASCTPAANAGCFVNYCGATTGCKNANISAGGTPWCQQVANGGGTFYTCTASGDWGDTDGDGFSDAAEAEGYIDNNLNGIYDAGVDVPLPGANPNRPDVYLHYDYVVASGHDYNPPSQAIQWVVDAFAAHGVGLHIDPQHNAIDDSVARVVTLANSPDPACTGPNALSAHQLREMFPNLKLLSPAYHYMVFGHYATCDPGIDPATGQPYCSACPNDPENPTCGTVVAQPPQPDNLGTAEIYGNDAIVATGGFVDVGLLPIPTESWAGLMMHELGHNLGLNHGGVDCYNQKPNYVSVMNYRFYTTGIPVGAAPGDTVPKSCTTDSDCAAGSHCSNDTNTCFRIDYSDRQFNSLDEAGGSGGLDETVGLQGGSSDTDISWYRIGQFLRIPTDGAPIDWNGNGVIETGVVRDVNGDVQKVNLTSQNDWLNLKFGYQCQPTFAGDAASLALLQKLSLVGTTSYRALQVAPHRGPMSRGSTPARNFCSLRKK